MANPLVTRTTVRTPATLAPAPSRAASPTSPSRTPTPLLDSASSATLRPGGACLAAGALPAATPASPTPPAPVPLSPAAVNATTAAHRRVRPDFPVEVLPPRDLFIPMHDGRRLAARLWLPVDAHEHPRPAIVEYLPYRKSDFMADRDAPEHAYFAGHGYASLRVDIAGTGDSDGILLDEYSPGEQTDALEIFAWLERQPWCTGRVGMYGISWGGFNGLQVAARRPTQLGAVITLGSTVDRYAHDVHFIGGAVLADQMLPWASVMHSLNALPPDPRMVGTDRWRSMWLDRLRRTPSFLEQWLGHQRRDDYWKQGSVCEDFSAIECPVLAVSGVADDGYCNAVPDLLAGLRGPRLGIIGPWAHNMPQSGRPGPAIGFLQECVRFWDQCLKGIETEIWHEPMLRTFVQEGDAVQGDAVPDGADRAGVRLGRWVAEAQWPSPRIEPLVAALTGDRGLALAGIPPGKVRAQGASPGAAQGPTETDAAPVMSITVDTDYRQGLAAGVWGPCGSPAGLPADQREEDRLSLTFDSEPLAQPMTILGQPQAKLNVAASEPQALVAVRLCDVAPDGRSRLISRGVLNLTHRDSHEHPQPLTPGQRYDVAVPLNMAAHRFTVGHRLRVAISPSYWPHAWPSPRTVRLSVFPSDSHVVLPVRPEGSTDARAVEPGPAAPLPVSPLPPPTFGPPESAAALPTVELRACHRDRRVEINEEAAVARIVDHTDEGKVRIESTGIECGADSTHEYVLSNDPLAATVTSRWALELGRGPWQVRVDSLCRMSCDAANFFIHHELRATQRRDAGDDEVVHQEVSDRVLARDYT